MTSRPSGVEQRYDMPGGSSYFGQVAESNWFHFCYLFEAQNLLANLMAWFPDITFKMVEDGEEIARYKFIDPMAPRIYLITGNNEKGDADFEEWAGDILTRMKCPYGLDKDGPYRPGDKLQPNLAMQYGDAFFYWSVRQRAPQLDVQVFNTSGGIPAAAKMTSLV